MFILIDLFRVVAGVGAAARPIFATQLRTKTNTLQTKVQKSKSETGVLPKGGDMFLVLAWIKTIPEQIKHQITSVAKTLQFSSC